MQANPRIRFELMDALAARLYTASSMKLRLRNGPCLLAALFCGVPAWADESADQLERARLLRDFQEAPARASSSDAAKTPSLPAATLDKAPSLPAATLEKERLRAKDSFSTQQLQDSQWRKLIGDQQMQLHQAFTGNTSESQWRAQIFERDRQAQELSTDILRRSLESGPAGRR
mgnify:CR=1 FL=1